MRVIDADALIDGYKHMGYDPSEHPEESYMEGWCKGFNSAVDHCIHHVIHAPTIEPERKTGNQLPPAQPEIIRCKDCEYWRSSDHTCHEHSLVSPMMANDFCSRAERRTDGNSRD